MAAYKIVKTTPRSAYLHALTCLWIRATLLFADVECLRLLVLSALTRSELSGAVQTKNVMALLASPYPHNGSVVVVNQTAQIINAAGQPVPLSEVRCSIERKAFQFFRGWSGILRDNCVVC